MHVIVAAFGTAGDTLPMIALARHLQQSGHEVDCLGLHFFAPQAQAAGVNFHPIGPPGLFEEFSRDPLAWHPYKGFGSLWRMISRAIPDTVEHIGRLRQEQQTVLVGTSGAVGVRLAQETWNLRAATVHMAPFYLFSQVDNCLGGVSWPAWMPDTLRRLVFAAVNRTLIDGLACSDLNALRAGLGLAPTDTVFTHWINSPDRVICAVPDWFAARQPDWPGQTVSVPFPIIPADAGIHPPWEPGPALRAFLDAGPPPLLFAAATGMGIAATFYRRAVAVGQQLRRRVLLVSRTAEPIPQPLPETAFHLDYAPFDQLLPRVSAIIHQGGIGTIALAMRAGLPQLIVPFAYDQFFNGQCVARLDVGRTVPRVTPPEPLARALEELLASDTVRQRCRYYRESVAAQSCGIAAMAREVEALAGR